MIQPPTARILIVIKGVQIFAEEFLRNASLSDQMQIRWEREWPKYATMIRRHFRGISTLGALTGAWGRGGSTLGFGIGSGFGW